MPTLRIWPKTTFREGPCFGKDRLVVEVRTPPSMVGRRIVAGLLDILLWTIILVLAAVRFGRHTAGTNGAALSLTGLPFLFYLLALLTYYIVLEWLWARTLGKGLLGLRVVGYSGGRITFTQSLVRNALRLVDGFPYFIPYLLGFLIFALSPRKQRLGDMLARTDIARYSPDRAP
jgi:uncharacterized RDD family membrane protein YckC